MRSAMLALALCAVDVQASSDYEVGPRLLDPLGVANDGLGYSVAGLSLPTGGALAAAGTVGTYVAVARLAANTSQFSIEQRLQSGVADDSFGLSVAIGGVSGELLAVGAPADDSFGLNTGRVYLYRRATPGGSFALIATLNPPAPAATGNFGTAVALSAAGDRLLVGEPKAQQAAVEVGAVHIYGLIGASVGVPQTVYSDLGAGGRFGQSLAISGTRVVVGAPLVDDVALQADTGALRLISLSGPTPVFEGAALYADDRAAMDRLGLSVAIDGDVLVGGAGNDDKPAGIEAGSAYVFRRGASWLQEAKLRSSSPQAQERFGQSVALHGDEILVGAYCLNVTGCIGSGAVYVYQYNGSAWLGTQRLAAADGSNFGHAMAYAGDRHMVIGAFASDGAFTDQGAIYAAFPGDPLFAGGFEN